MRTRQKSYKDHGITDNDKERIFKYCFNANSEKMKIIDIALSEIPRDLKRHIKKSLVKGMSYEDIDKEDYIYISKGDFYGYRRQAMECIKRWMILYNIWEFEEVK